MNAAQRQHPLYRRQHLVFALIASGVAIAIASPASAQKRASPAAASVTAPAPVATVIYKLVDEGGRVTYSNLPLKGATIIELDPISVISANSPTAPVSEARAPQPSNLATVSAPASTTAAQPAAASSSAAERALLASIALPSVDASTQKKRDTTRRTILNEEMAAEEQLLANAQSMLKTHESDRTAILAMKSAAEKQNPGAYAEARRQYLQREERLKVLQDSVSNHEQNLAALKKELAVLK